MDAWFTIETEPAHGLVLLTMGGFFDPSKIGELRTAFVDALPALQCAPNAHVTLCDISEMKIQAQEIVGEFAQLVGHPSVRSRRLAFVTRATLAQLQARRLTDRDGVRFFDDIATARAWLMAG